MSYNKSKVQIVNPAYEELRIWGITSNPTPSEKTMALERLEMMMWELFGQWNLAINYNFEQTPNLNSLCNVTPNYHWFMITNLATRLIAAFNKQVPPQLEAQAGQALSGAIGIHAFEVLQQIQPPARMPMGNGNTFRQPYWNRFMLPVNNAPNLPTTNYLIQGERQGYAEPFTDWLGGNTISSFTIEADPMLTLISSAISGTSIIYTVSAPADTVSNGPLQQVLITVTDSASRVEIRLVNFQVNPAPIVGS